MKQNKTKCIHNLNNQSKNKINKIKQKTLSHENKTQNKTLILEIFDRTSDTKNFAL